MSRNTKTILIIVGGLLILCICGCVLFGVGSQVVAALFLNQSMVTSPAEVENVGQQIADYEVPPGYSADLGMSFFGFDLVGLTSGGTDARNVIFMMQFPSWAASDPASMEAQLEQSVQQQLGNNELNLETVGEETVTIRDQSVTLTIREGSNDQGATIRQITGIFQGRGGPTMLMILGSTETWDQAAIDQFLASIR